MSTKTKYQKKNEIDHVKDRPDMYVGSIIFKNSEEYVVVDDENYIEQKNIKTCPAILRIFIEPLSNSVDNLARSKKNKFKMTKICIDIDEKTGETSFYNDGEYIPIEIHEDEKCYNHTLVFGTLRTGSNYDDGEDRIDISGKNGIGIKAVNIFSKKFTIEGVDPLNKKYFKQTWEDNMKIVGEPLIKKSTETKGYTKITYIPDFEYFGIKNYTDDIISVYKKLIIDSAMITKLPIIFNGKEILIENLVKYAKLYDRNFGKDFIDMKSSDCDVVLVASNESQSISFANGMCTSLGGVHVDAWNEAIFRPLLQKINKPKKPQLNIGDIKKFFRLFVVASVKKPSFDAQTKTKLEGPEITAEVKKSHLGEIMKWSIMNNIQDMVRLKEMVVLKKVERKKRGYERVEGLDPANNEGGKLSRECSLILVEGLSAKSYASNGIIKGIFGKQGRDWYGIYALRGKVLNTRNATPGSVAKNSVVTDIIKALNLQFGLDYLDEDNFKKLRYGKIIIITDADVDGLHISGLIQNLFHSLFPTLLKRKESFLVSMQTPIVRVYKSKTKNILFYDERQYQKYVHEFYTQNPGKKIDKKYYKGLGTSSKEDVLETFGQKMIEFFEDEKTSETMNKCFHTKFADYRKDWLANYDTENIKLVWDLDKTETRRISHSDFIDTEIIKFSISDCKRSIPNIMDGLKEGHRKILYVAFLRKLNYGGKTLKVHQFAASVAEKSSYHHGEQNLVGTLSGMASDFVGSNNIPLFYRDGQFGTRYEGGKDCAEGRYICTKLDALTRLIFRKEDDDILDYLEDDGDKVEPKFYVPIIPTILINGIIAGIGTGWSTSIPCYNPLDIINCIKIWLDNDGIDVVTNDENGFVSSFPEILPWYRGFTGEIKRYDDNKYISWGRIERQGKDIKVVELPVGLWTNKFVEELEILKEEKRIANYKNYSEPDTVNFTIIPSDDGIECSENGLKLYKYISTSNMVMFDSENKLKKYNIVDQIIDEYCKVRFDFYTKRKNRILNDLKNNIKFLGNKKRFLQEIIDQDFKLFEQVKGKNESRKTFEIISELEEKKYDKKLEDEEGDNDDEDNEASKKKKNHGYGYLLNMQINNVTSEKIDKLQNDIDSFIKEKDETEKTKEKDIWIKELGELEVGYKKYLADSSPSEKSEKKIKKSVIDKKNKK